MFGLGGLTGLPLGLAATDIPLHDTNYVVGHFHYLVAPGTIFALFAGIYYWFPKITGRMMNETLGRIHFAGSLVCMNLIFMPMFDPGPGRREPAAVGRRRDLSLARAGCSSLNMPMSHAAFALGVLPAVLHRQPVREHAARPRRRRQSVAGDDARVGDADAAAGARQLRARAAGVSRIPTTTACLARRRTSRRRTPRRRTVRMMDAHSRTPPSVRPDTGLTNPKLGIWLFLASEVMLFGSLFSVYALLRTARRRGRISRPILNVPLAALNTVILISLVGDDGDGVGRRGKRQAVALPAVHGADAARRRAVPRREDHRVQREVLARAVSVHEQLPRPVFHDDRPARHSRDRRDGRQRVPARVRARGCGRASPSASPTASRSPASTGTSSTSSGSSCSRCSICYDCSSPSGLGSQFVFSVRARAT